MTNDVQIRGNCQVCGRQHAVVKGVMAKHGYKVQHGYFNGVCSGQHYRPLQHDRSVTDFNVREWKAKAEALRASAQDFRDGKVFPEVAKSAAHYKAPMVPFNQAQPYFQKQAVEHMIFSLLGEARFLEGHAKMMGEFADQIFGTDLIKVAKKDAPEAIQEGEKRVLGNGKIATVYSVDGARVRWKTEDGFKSWTGSAAWRKYEKVA
ncbi:hypothetical protein [Ralstonia phage RSP15]|uniref:hypothetical protein n=1 Tax=Ralstonia phage RSP15 TaxID=1785960 RepID=UPI00074D4D68|nr:hypothetical protein BH754_gp123 [Ralstonia phage RSP15]BAU40183.1 hypothetical protein [Ralstonia phage RSP15]